MSTPTSSFIMETKSMTTKTQARSSFHEFFIRRSSSWKIRLFPKPVGRIPKTLCFWATVSRHSFCSASCLKSESHQIKDMKRTLQRTAQSCLKFNAETIFVGLDKIMQMHKHFSRSINYLSQSYQQSSIHPIRTWYQGLISWNGNNNGMSTGSPVHSLVARPLSAFPPQDRLHS